MIKTFRGTLDDNTVNKLRLSTKKGKIGYKIVKFQVIPEQPGVSDYENVVSINKVDFSPLLSIDLSDGNILAVAYWASGTNPAYPQESSVIIFEQETFNQDIFIGSNGTSASMVMNYYVEIESFPLTDNAAAVSTLRDIRLNPQVGG